MIDFEDKWDPVGVPPGYYSQHPQGRGNRVASAFDSQFDYILRIEVDWVGGERGAGGVLNPLIDR